MKTIFLNFRHLREFHRRRQWHPTPVLLPGKSRGWRSLVGCSPWGRWGLGMTWATSLSLFTFMHWRRKWQPTPVFLPGESQGRGSLVGCRLWGHTELDTTAVTYQQQQRLPWVLCIILSRISWYQSFSFFFFFLHLKDRFWTWIRI